MRGTHSNPHLTNEGGSAPGLAAGERRHARLRSSRYDRACKMSGSELHSRAFGPRVSSAPRAVVSTVVGRCGPGRRPSRSAFFVTCEYSWWRGASVYLPCLRVDRFAREGRRLADWATPPGTLRFQNRAIYPVTRPTLEQRVSLREPQDSYDLRSCDAQLLTESVTRRHARSPLRGRPPHRWTPLAAPIALARG